jgi:integrase
MTDTTTVLVQVAVPTDLQLRHALGGVEVSAAATYLASLSAGSLVTAEAALHEIARFLSGGEFDAFRFPWGALRYEHTSAVRAYLVRSVGPSTARKKLSFLRGALKEAWRLGQIDGEQYHRAIDLAPVRGHSAREGRALATDELGALLAVCDADSSPAGLRDAALFAIGYGGGLRRAELCALEVADVLRLRQVRIRSGKGGKGAFQPLPPSAGPRIRVWVEVRGGEAGPLLLPITKGGRVVWREVPRDEQRKAGTHWRRLSLRALSKIIDKRRRQAGLEPFKVHDLRRSFITHVLEATGDLAKAQRLARHSDPKTTALYDRRHEETDRTAVDMLDVRLGGRRDDL